MFRKLRIPIVIVVTALLTEAVGLAVQAAVPGALRPSGVTRYAVASANDSVSMSSTSWVDIPGLSQSITIPSGKRGDVFISFCGNGEVVAGSPLSWVRAMVGGRMTEPPAFALSGSGNDTDCAEFYKLNVAAGTKNVRMQWGLFGAGTLSVHARVMIVTVNIHD